jgi:hypothetical protein
VSVCRGTHGGRRSGCPWFPAVSRRFRPRERGPWPKPRRADPRPPVRHTSRPVDDLVRPTRITPRAPGSSDRKAALRRRASRSEQDLGMPSQRVGVSHASVRVQERVAGRLRAPTHASTAAPRGCAARARQAPAAQLRGYAIARLAAALPRMRERGRSRRSGLRTPARRLYEGGRVVDGVWRCGVRAAGGLWVSSGAHVSIAPSLAGTWLNRSGSSGGACPK